MPSDAARQTTQRFTADEEVMRDKIVLRQVAQGAGDVIGSDYSDVVQRLLSRGFIRPASSFVLTDAGRSADPFAASIEEERDGF